MLITEPLLTAPAIVEYLRKTVVEGAASLNAVSASASFPTATGDTCYMAARQGQKVLGHEEIALCQREQRLVMQQTEAQPARHFFACPTDTPEDIKRDIYLVHCPLPHGFGVISLGFFEDPNTVDGLADNIEDFVESFFWLYTSVGVGRQVSELYDAVHNREQAVCWLVSQRARLYSYFLTRTSECLTDIAHHLEDVCSEEDITKYVSRQIASRTPNAIIQENDNNVAADSIGTDYVWKPSLSDYLTSLNACSARFFACRDLDKLNHANPASEPYCLKDVFDLVLRGIRYVTDDSTVSWLYKVDRYTPPMPWPPHLPNEPIDEELKQYYLFLHEDVDLTLQCTCNFEQLSWLLDCLLRNVSRAVSCGQVYIQAAIEEATQHTDGQEWFRIIVRDSGAGIPPARLEQAKIIGWYLLPPNGSMFDNSGLGLYVCDKICHAHNGSLTLKNLEPHGLEVTVRLPAVLDKNSSLHLPRG